MAKDAKREALGDLKKMLSSGLGKRLAAKHAPPKPESEGKPELEAPKLEGKGAPATLHVAIMKEEPAEDTETPGEAPDAEDAAAPPTDLKSLISKHLDGLLPRRKR